MEETLGGFKLDQQAGLFPDPADDRAISITSPYCLVRMLSDRCRFEGDFDEPEVPDEVLSNARNFRDRCKNVTMLQRRWTGFSYVLLMALEAPISARGEGRLFFQ